MPDTSVTSAAELVSILSSVMAVARHPAIGPSGAASPQAARQLRNLLAQAKDDHSLAMVAMAKIDEPNLGQDD